MQVVNDAPRREHPAGGDDDARTIESVQIFRFFDRAMELNVPGKQTAPSVFDQVVIETQVVDVLAVDSSGVHRHWAVNVNGYIRELTGVDELAKDQGYELGPSYGKGRDEDDSASIERLDDGLTDLLPNGAMVVLPVTVGRLHEEEITRGRW